MRPVYFLLGWCFFGLGAVGIVVPGLPTVPFMLVALWLFSRSSKRFHDWLYQHPVFGPPLQQWRSHGVIPVRAKVLAVVTMVASLCYLTFLTDVRVGIAAMTGLVMLVGALFILRQPSRIPENEPASRD
ncbi:MAG: YbaN family protein [Gammaproteobacteria bacterium]